MAARSKQIYPHPYVDKLQLCFISCSKLFCYLLALIILTRFVLNVTCCVGNLLCCSIVMPGQSVWHHLYENADSHSFLLMTGLSRDVFQMLMDTLSSGSTWSVCCTGRPHSLSPSAELGLFLFYIDSTMTLKHLCLI